MGWETGQDGERGGVCSFRDYSQERPNPKVMSQPGRAAKPKGTASVKAASAASTVERERGVFEEGGGDGGPGLAGPRQEVRLLQRAMSAALLSFLSFGTIPSPDSGSRWQWFLSACRGAARALGGCRRLLALSNSVCGVPRGVTWENTFGCDRRSSWDSRPCALPLAAQVTPECLPARAARTLAAEGSFSPPS